MIALAALSLLAERAAWSFDAAAVYVDAVLIDGGHISPPRSGEARELRALAEVPAHVPIRVVDVDAPPTVHGHAGAHVTATGSVVRNAKRYRLAGGRTLYRPSTMCLEVGLLWLTSWRCRGGAR